MLAPLQPVCCLLAVFFFLFFPRLFSSFSLFERRKKIKKKIKKNPSTMSP